MVVGAFVFSVKTVGVAKTTNVWTVRIVSSFTVVFLYKAAA